MAAPTPWRWLFSPSTERRRRAWRYWGHDTFVGVRNAGVHHVLRLLPSDWCSAYGAILGGLAPRRFPASDGRARALWREFHPEASGGSALDAAMRRLWRNVGRTMAEYSVLDRILCQGRVAIEGREWVRAAQASGRPLLVVGLHLANWELIGAALGELGSPVSLVYLVPANRFEHRLVRRARQRCGIGLIPGRTASTRQALRILQDGGNLLMFIDELARGRVQAPALGRPLRATGNISYAVRLAAMTGAVVLPSFCLRLGDAARFRLAFLPAIEIGRGARDKSDVLGGIGAINAVIEPVIRANLDQWFYGLDFRFDR